MSLPQYEHFKFKVGEIVQPVSVNLDFGKQFKLTSKGPAAMQVVERIYQECPGGVQLHYKVRAYFGEASGYARELDTFNEIELVAFGIEGKAAGDDLRFPGIEVFTQKRTDPAP